MFKLKLPPFENVVASQTAVMPRLPRGNMYDAIVLELGGGNTQANMSAIRLLANGKIVWNITGTHLDTINNYDKLKDTATFLCVPFADFTADGQIQSQIGSFDTSEGIEEFGVEVDLGAGVAPTLKAFSLVSPPSAKGDRFARAFKSVLKTVHAPGAAGQFNLPVALGSRAGGFLRRVAMFHAGGLMTGLAVKRDGVNLQDDITLAELAYMNELSRRTAQANMMVFDPISAGALDDMVPTLRSDGNAASFEFLATVSAAETVTAYSEMIATLDRI